MIIHYFVHSTSVDNALGVRAGWSDPVLSELGRLQAKELGSQISELDVEAVFASDLARAVETAQTAFAGIDIRLDARLREMNYGVLNGRHVDDFPDDETSHIDRCFEGGESCMDVEERLRAFLADSAASHERIAIVSHRYPQLALEVICNSLAWEDALAQDWRRHGGWKPGWQYTFGLY